MKDQAADAKTIVTTSPGSNGALSVYRTQVTPPSVTRISGVPVRVMVNATPPRSTVRVNSSPLMEVGSISRPVGAVNGMSIQVRVGAVNVGPVGAVSDA